MIPSSIALVTLPCSAVASGNRERRWALGLGLLGAGGILASDVAIGWMIEGEGRDDFARFWSSAPEPLLIWAVL